MAFLPVFETEINKAKVRTYRNTEANLLVEESEAIKYLNELWLRHTNLFQSKNTVAILWQSEEVRMADLWVFGENESETAGAEVSVYLFKEMERYESPVVTATDGLIVLGNEARDLINN